MPTYRYGPDSVLVETTGEFAIGATGIFRATEGGDPVAVTDLNGSPIPSILVGPKGAHQAFKADIPNGVLDFGSVLLPKISDEAQAAGLDAMSVAAGAALTAQQAQAAAQDAANSAATSAATSASGARGASMSTIYVASSTASATEKALAGPTYTCDGTADDVQIQAAVDAIKAAGGGRVVLSAGRFEIATPVQVAGNGSRFGRARISIQGAGMGVTMLRTFAGTTSSIHLTAFVQVDIADLGFFCYGGSSGITSAQPAANSWAFWLSTFRNLYFEGTSDGLATGWAMSLEGAFRSTFDNIEAAGMVNGIRLYNASAGFFNGNCTFNRVFLLTNGDNGIGFHLDAATGTIINAIDFNLVEGFATGANTVGVKLGGSGGQVNHTRWRTTNFEDYTTVFWVNNGTGNEVDGDFWSVNPAAAANTSTLLRFDAAAYGNRLKAITGHYTTQAHRLVVSSATDTNDPNIVENVALTLDPGGAVTNSISTPGSVLFRSIVARGANAAGASTVAVRPATAAGAVIVIHGTNAATARPATTGPVIWFGTVRPDNLADGDVYQTVTAES